MSVFNELLLPKIKAIQDSYTKNFQDDLKAIFECFDKFEEEHQNGRSRAREKGQKDKNLITTLQSIHEDEGDENKQTEPEKTKRLSKTQLETNDSGITKTNTETKNKERNSKKRSKNEVDGIISPEQDKRQKRNASVKAQSIISKQVNVNLTQKMRREDPADASRRRKGSDKENWLPIVQIKQEKISLPPKPEEMDLDVPLNIEVKQEPNKDQVAMPPPSIPVPKPRKVQQKEKETVEDSSEEDTSKRRTKGRKQTETMPPPAVPTCTRITRASSRAAPSEPAPEPRPKRTRTKKKLSIETSTETEKETSQETAQSSPTAKPRPKRTRRGQKAAEKEAEKPEEPKPTEQEKPISPEPVKEDRISQPQIQSPIIPHKDSKSKTKPKNNIKKQSLLAENDVTDTVLAEGHVPLNETRVIAIKNEDEKILTNGVEACVTQLDTTVVLPNGVYSHAPATPKNVRTMNETVLIEKNMRETIVVEKNHVVMNATVVIEKADAKVSNLTDDNSILTDDNSDAELHTPPNQNMPVVQPTSAVKEKVQQFEEMASRVTRTKTRAMVKKVDEETEYHTPPDKVSKAILSAETLAKMNCMIFNGKGAQTSASASKPRTNIVSSVKSMIPASTSKISAINKAKDAVEEMKIEKEDARKKKEAMLDAKRELQRRKREEKMAAAAACRTAAEKERLANIEALTREKLEKQAQLHHGRRVERMREVERKKQELARKAAETEERRKAEELARQQRLAEEQRRADAVRRKQIEEAEAMKKEAAVMAKEIEKRQKEYLEKQKMKQKLESIGKTAYTPLKHCITPGRPRHMSPVYMQDGFQYLNSDSEEESVNMPVPAFSTSKMRKHQLLIQSQVSSCHVDRLFSVRVHSPDLRDLFPNIERARLKRTSSAVWRTPT